MRKGNRRGRQVIPQTPKSVKMVITQTDKQITLETKVVGGQFLNDARTSDSPRGKQESTLVFNNK